MSTPILLSLVASALKAGDFDGLYCPPAECGCLAEDLAPCESPSIECKAGYRSADPAGNPDDWIIGPHKVAAPGEGA